MASHDAAWTARRLVIIVCVAIAVCAASTRTGTGYAFGGAFAGWLHSVHLGMRFWVGLVSVIGGITTAALAYLLKRNIRNRLELERVRNDARRLTAEARFRTVFDSAAMGIVLFDRAGVVCEANPAFDAMLGHENRWLIGRYLESLTHPSDRETAVRRFADLVAGHVKEYHYEKRFLRADGTRMWADTYVSRLPSDDPSGWFAIGMVDDITERKRIEQQLRYDATHDGLTGLANRSLFATRLNDVLLAKADGTSAVVFIDLDHFKVVNDSLGHAAGDTLLRTVAERLAKFAGPSDTVARFGGDEFAVLFAGLAHVADLTRRVKLIADRVSEPLDVAGRSVSTTASIGVAPITPRYTAADDLLRDADIAMYHAKADGRARATLFDQAMHDRAVRRLALTSALRLAVDNAELRLAYQPIVRLSDRTVIGHEALLRWAHPSDGMIMPDDFIPLAEETGLIVPLGRWALDEACRRLAEVRRVNTAMSMHVNLSVQEIMQTDCASYIEDRLAAHGVSPEALIVEITESAIIESTQSADTFLRRLRSIGVGVCIDDFGVGYSSLRYLHRFPISGMKIDRSFVSGSDDDLSSEPIVRMLLELARTLGLDIVAEGIETPRQSAALRALGCLYGQGYFYGRPQFAVCV